MFVLAHLSDPHLPTPPGAPLVLFANKRALGYLSWRLRRVRIHRPEVLAALAADLKAQRPDHIVVTGDLVNVALASEFLRAAAWLADLGRPDAVTVIPGNHDAYVDVPFAQSLAFWAPHLAGDAEPAGVFPFVRRRGPLALVGLSTAQPSAPGLAWGALGAAQGARLAEILAGLAGEDRFRVVLLHHPPLAAAVPAVKRLRDAGAFAAIIEAHGAELILHGHNHRHDRGALAGPAGAVPVIGVASASALPHGRHPGAHYHLYRIERTAAGWAVDVVARGYDAASGAVAETSVCRHALAAPRPAAAGGRAVGAGR